MKLGSFEVSVTKAKKEKIPDGKAKRLKQEESDRFSNMLKVRSVATQRRSERELLNLAFVLGQQDAYCKDGKLWRSLRANSMSYMTDKAKGEGTLAKLKAQDEVPLEIENLLIQPLLQTVVKVAETPFTYEATPVGSSHEDKVKARAAEKFIKVLERDRTIGFKRARARTMMNTAIAGCHYLWPMYNKHAGPRRIVHKAVKFETPFPLVDAQGNPLKDGGHLYAETDKKGNPLDISYVNEGQLELQSIPMRDIFVPKGPTYLDECQNVIVRTAVRVEDLEHNYKETSGVPIKTVLDKVSRFYPGEDYREQLLQQLQASSGSGEIDIAEVFGADKDTGDGEFTMLYHFLEKPTHEYPLGRWASFVLGGEPNTADGEVYMLQDFPLPADGESGFPLIEVSGPKIDGRFQGLTLLEFAIPAQVRHNQLLTTRMDHYRKASESWLLVDKRHTPSLQRIPGVGGIWQYDSVGGGKDPQWLQPPQLSAALFKEDASPRQYIEALFGLWNLKYPMRSDRTATEIATLAQESAQWVRDYGILGQARAFSNIAYWMVWLFKNYATYGKYGQVLNYFSQYERELFMQTSLDCTDIRVDERTLMAQDKMLQQQKLQLAAQINPEYFKTPEGKKVAARVLDFEDIFEDTEQSRERAVAIAENGEFYQKLKARQPLTLNKPPVPDEEDVVHIIEHLSPFSEPVIHDLPAEQRDEYIKAVLTHCVKYHLTRLKARQKMGAQEDPIMQEYIVRVELAVREAKLDSEAIAKESPLGEIQPEPDLFEQPDLAQTEEGRKIPLREQDLVEMASGKGDPLRRPAQMLMSQLMREKQGQQSPQSERS